MTKKAFAQDTRKTAPKLEFTQTRNGKLYRVCYGGMCNEYSQEIRAIAFFRQALEAWSYRFKLNAIQRYLALPSDDSCNERRRVDSGNLKQALHPSSETPSGRFLSRDITVADDVDDCF